MTQGAWTATMELPSLFGLSGTMTRGLEEMARRGSKRATEEAVAETQTSHQAPVAQTRDSTAPAESGAAAAKAVVASYREYLAEGEPSLQFEESAHVQATKPTTEAQSIIRSVLAKSILADLQSIQKYARDVMAAAYAGRLLKAMRAMRDLVPYDPYVKVVMALYDSMAYGNRWADYDAEQYQGAYEILKQLAKQTNVDRRKLAKAVLQLEELGFNTTPYGMSAREES